MLGIFAFFAGIRVAIIAMACLVPNVIITVGGAEFTGWTTHYHAMYFPILIFTALQDRTIMQHLQILVDVLKTNRKSEAILQKKNYLDKIILIQL